MSLQSLDPRVTRLQIPEWTTPMEPIAPMDQFQTFEVFVQHKENKPIEHVGIVHAPNEEMAFLFAKEQYTRRGNTCFALWVVETERIMVSPVSEKGICLYDMIEEGLEHQLEEGDEAFEVFHLYKRGKQHAYAGRVMANSPDEAIVHGKRLYKDPKKPVLNIWVVPTSSMLFSDEEDKEIWNTLSEKTYREAIDYRAADKIKKFKEEQQAS
jgi:ring-1,2-phenylacetyl-CoA epoxidase subunit PaaB